MNKRDALRLKPGTRVLCADHQYSAKATRWWTGEVVHVTDAGGILVRITEGRSSNYMWEGPGTGPDAGTEKWFPYSRVTKEGRQ